MLPTTILEASLKFISYFGIFLFLVSLCKQVLKTHQKANIFCCVLQQKHIRKPIRYFLPLKISKHLCLVLLQVPKCFGLVQMFCARPNIYLHIVAVTIILCQTKLWFAFSKNVFCVGTNVFEEAVKFLGWLKKFGPAQNNLGPVKGQGINVYLWC